MTILLKNFIYSTIIVGFLLIILGLVSGRLSSKIGYRWRKPVWILLLFLFLVPFSALQTKMFRKSDLKYQAVQKEWEGEEDIQSQVPDKNSIDKSDSLLTQDTDQSQKLEAEDTEQSQELDPQITSKKESGIKNIWFEIDDFINRYSFWLNVVWLIGVIVSIRFYIIAEKYTENKLILFSEKPVEKRLLAIMEKVCKKMEISEKINIRYNSKISSPVFYRIWHPTIYIPKTLDLPDSQWEYIFSHELYHYKACDIIYKKFISVCVCILWFHPMVYYIRKKAYEDLEYICDSKVTETMDKGQIAEYCQCILQMVPVKNHVLMSFCNTKKRLQKRFDNCFNVKKKKRNVFVTVAICSGIMFFAITSMLFIKEVLGNRVENRNVEEKYMMDFQKKESVERKNNISEAGEEQEKEKPEDSKITKLKLSQRAIHYDTGIQAETNKLERLRDMWLRELSEEEENKVKKLIFEVHSYMENKLVYRFKGNDCSPDSKIWNIIDDDPNDNVIEGYTGINMIDDLNQAKQIVNKDSFSFVIEEIINQLEIVIEIHDIDLLYEIHQKMHDLSYWAINYPIEDLDIAPADWNGINVYFGTLDKIAEE